MAEVKPWIAGSRVGVAAVDWRNAIQISCEPLVEVGAATPAYPQHCIDLVAEHGPYVVLAPRLALAHARPEDGALRTGIAVATLSRPVSFGHPDNDPVDLIFAFCSPDKDQHVGLLSKLAERIASGLDGRLRDARSAAEADAILEEDLGDTA